MSVTVSIELRAVQDLAEELAALAAELATEAELCRSATYTLASAVDGDTAAAAGQLGTGWAGLVDVVAQGTGALAGTLRQAVQAYRLHDAALSDRVLFARAGVPVP
ncbi:MULTISPECIES: hypothetical protein [unclassified Blastococcus]